MIARMFKVASGFIPPDFHNCGIGARNHQTGDCDGDGNNHDFCWD